MPGSSSAGTALAHGQRVARHLAERDGVLDREAMRELLRRDDLHSTFNLLYCFFIISHDRRRILHFNLTRHPSSLWIVQQLREAFPYQSAPKFLIF
jgi:hypothetical protein